MMGPTQPLSITRPRRPAKEPSRLSPAWGRAEERLTLEEVEAPDPDLQERLITAAPKIMAQPVEAKINEQVKILTHMGNAAAARVKSRGFGPSAFMRGHFDANFNIYRTGKDAAVRARAPALGICYAPPH